MTSSPGNKLENCIDNNENTFCYSGQKDAYPWLALEFDTIQDISKLSIINRKDCCGERARGLQVFVSDSLPTTAKVRFTKGHLLGSFSGPGTNGQLIDIVGKKSLVGKYVIIQTNPSGNSNIGGHLNLQEVYVYGRGKLLSSIQPIRQSLCQPDERLNLFGHTILSYYNIS